MYSPEFQQLTEIVTANRQRVGEEEDGKLDLDKRLWKRMIHHSGVAGELYLHGQSFQNSSSVAPLHISDWA